MICQCRDAYVCRRVTSYYNIVKKVTNNILVFISVNTNRTFLECLKAENVRPSERCVKD